jgi:triosephosphate isomerase
MGLARPIIFGNWKMHGLRADGLALARAVSDGAAATRASLGIFPPATLLREVAALAGKGVVVGGQDCHEQAKGAFTGSIAASMIADAGATAVILGHSERRHGQGESDLLIARKVEAALAAGLLCVVCIGETEAEWASGRRDEVLARQVRESLPEAAPSSSAPSSSALSSSEMAARLIVAYEPVWAIGTGRTPSTADVEQTHAFVRAQLTGRFKDGASIPILYGGSVKPDNAAALLTLAGVDGALVGGASLDPEAFLAIARAAAPG